ncbi:prepilin-type N-terminal cleavage/methylation domain-containing protein [Halanaerobium saccharolyticum]|uniref:Prepilin-type N-terminal cleavage/methylation domain-containing protein n=1 Tax=Halanaerobium saccharolyticum TaxID=43595 RepID=A0A4R6LU82_9FIRM|nr:type II secretion system protein [Halanaerobium saccharolyticum]TDO92258.1 prepilin-type N-terminal cleavage/methylation domain-containing protein [Halanaerobium saccharolyticum]
MYKRMNLKNNNGFTLVEILLVILILAVVMTIGATTLIQVFNIVPESNERMSTRQLAEINLSTIATYIRNAEEVNPDNDTITINEDGILKIIRHSDKSIKKNGEVLINDIETFSIEKDDDTEQENLYIVTIEKCAQEECEENTVLTEQVLVRN